MGDTSVRLQKLREWVEREVRSGAAPGLPEEEIRRTIDLLFDVYAARIPPEAEPLLRFVP